MQRDLEAIKQVVMMVLINAMHSDGLMKSLSGSFELWMSTLHIDAAELEDHHLF